MADEEQASRFLIRALQLNDLPFLVALEQSSFPPNEAATPEKVEPPQNMLIVAYLSCSNLSRNDAGPLRSYR